MAPTLTPNRATVAKREAEKKEGLEKRQNTSIVSLQNDLIKFYQHIMRDVNLLNSHATEQAKSSSSKTSMQKNQKMSLDECMEILCDEIGECVANSGIGFDEPALLLHKKMYDVMLRRPPHK